MSKHGKLTAAEKAAKRKAAKAAKAARGELPSYEGFLSNRRSSEAILSENHPFYKLLENFVETVEVSDLEQLVGDQLGGALPQKVADRLFGHSIDPDEGMNAYRNVVALHILQPGLLADRRAVAEGPDAASEIIRTAQKLWEEAVTRIDYRSGKKGWDYTLANQLFTIEGLGLRTGAENGLSEIHEHAWEMHHLAQHHDTVFERALARDFSGAFRVALSLSASGTAHVARDRATRCVATHYVICSAEHLQRAIAWVEAAMRSCVPEVLLNNIKVDGNARTRTANAVHNKLSDLMLKYFGSYEERSSAIKMISFVGQMGPLEILIRKIVEKRFKRATNAQLDAWHIGIANIVRIIAAGIDARPFGNQPPNPKQEIFTHWFGYRQRVLLLTIALRIQQARSIAKSIIADPAAFVGADLNALLYPTALPASAMVSGEDAQSLCTRMIEMGRPQKDSAAETAEIGNVAAVDHAFTLLKILAQRRRASTVLPTRAEQFFAAFDPLAIPERKASQRKAR